MSLMAERSMIRIGHPAAIHRIGQDEEKGADATSLVHLAHGAKHGPLAIGYCQVRYLVADPHHHAWMTAELPRQFCFRRAPALKLVGGFLHAGLEVEDDAVSRQRAARGVIISGNAIGDDGDETAHAMNRLRERGSSRYCACHVGANPT